MVQKTGPWATFRGVHKLLFSEEVIHGIAICGHRASAAWSRFQDQNLVLKMGPEIGTRAREKTATVASNFGRWGLRFCAPAEPFVARPLPTHVRPSTRPVSRTQPRNPRRRTAMGGGVGLASAAEARARAM